MPYDLVFDVSGVVKVQIKAANIYEARQTTSVDTAGYQDHGEQRHHIGDQLNDFQFALVYLARP